MQTHNYKATVSSERHNYDDERDKTVFHNTTPDLQDQDQVQDRFFWSQTGLLRPTVTDHITDSCLCSCDTWHVCVVQSRAWRCFQTRGWNTLTLTCTMVSQTAPPAYRTVSRPVSATPAAPASTGAPGNTSPLISFVRLSLFAVLCCRWILRGKC